MPELNYFFIVWNGIRERSLCLKRFRLIKQIMRIGREDSNRFDDRIGLDKNIHNRFNCSEKICSKLHKFAITPSSGYNGTSDQLEDNDNRSRMFSVCVYIYQNQLRLSLLNLFELLNNANGAIWIIGDLEWGTGSIFCSNHRNPRSYQLSYLETGSGRKISRLIESLDKRYLSNLKGDLIHRGFLLFIPKSRLWCGVRAPQNLK